MAKGTLWGISPGGFKSHEKCRDFFAALVQQNKLGITADALMDQLATAAGEAQKYVYDGPSATSIALTGDKFLTSDAAGARTVAEWFAQDRGREALSQANGYAIFIRQGDWDNALFGLVPSTYDSTYGSGTLMHELLHKHMVGGGFTHSQIEKALAAVRGTGGLVEGHNNDSQRLANICFE